MNIFLVIVAIIMTVMILAGSLYVLVYFQAEEDRNTAYAPKVAVVLGLTLACLTVLLLPMDVANRATNGGLDMELLYQIVYMAIAIMTVGVIPFLIFYYEAEDPESRDWQIWTAIKYEFITVVVAVTTVVLMWVFLGTAEVPVELYSFNSTLIDSNKAVSCPAGCEREGVSDFYQIAVTPVVYVMALSSFVGWFLLVTFGGVGLAALPVDLLVAYKNRPQPIDLQEYAKQKNMLNERAQKLIEVGKALGPDAARARGKAGRTYNKFKQAVYFLEKDWERVKLAYKQRGGNPLLHMLMVVLGFLSLLLSIVWVLHIILYVFIQPPPSQFLNEYFIALDNFFPLFGTVTYGIFTFYLLFCVIKGCIKLGMRFFCISIHPMAIGNTLMNSFLFNVMLLLLTSVSIVQFCAICFASYARLTAVDMLFGVQVQNLLFFQWFYRNDVFLYAIVATAFVASVWLAICPRDKSALDNNEDDHI